MQKTLSPGTILNVEDAMLYRAHTQLEAVLQCTMMSMRNLLHQLLIALMLLESSSMKKALPYRMSYMVLALYKQ